MSFTHSQAVTSEGPSHDPIAATTPGTDTVTTQTDESALLHRSLIETPSKVASAHGSYLTLEDRRRILDACGGAAVVSIGHGRHEVLDATVAQMLRVSYIHTGTYTTDSAEDLASLILSFPCTFDHGLVKAFFVSSGSEATDSVMKLARQHFWEQGQTQRVHFVSRKGSYHGNTIAAMSISTNMGRKIPYDGAITLPNVSYVSAANMDNEKRRDEDEEDFVARLVKELEDEFQRVGPDTVIAFVAETVIGATSGSVCAPNGYFSEVKKVCEKYGILLILDEVMCGMGRTGTYFAFEKENVCPDLVTVGKGLGGGYTPIAGVLISEKVVSVLRNGTASFNHGFTYQAHATSCATAYAVQKIIRRENLVHRVAVYGDRLKALLHIAFENCRFVGDIRGIGLFWTVTFNADRASKRPLRPGFKFACRVQAAAFEKGVAVYPGPVQPEGAESDHVLIAPPYTVTDEELGIIVSVLWDAYGSVEASYISQGE